MDLALWPAHPLGRANIHRLQRSVVGSPHYAISGPAPAMAFPSCQRRNAKNYSFRTAQGRTLHGVCDPRLAGCAGISEFIKRDASQSLVLGLFAAGGCLFA